VKRRAIVGAVAALAAAPAAAQAEPGVIEDGGARFEVLSPTLIRLEYAADGRFEDRPTMLAYDRAIDPPRYETRVEGETRVIDTGRVEVRYHRFSGPFGPANLRITVEVAGRRHAAAPAWQPASYAPPAAGLGPLGYYLAQPGDAQPRTEGNLGGWARGLDSQHGPRALHDGLLSRDGWFFIDDTRSVLLTDGGARFTRRPAREGPYQDGYLFGYGHDYAAAFADYRRLSGPPPLLPRRAFGVWFSRYHAYTEADYRERLLPAFRAERVPLDVLMVDTDFKAPHAWNGWNWRSSLFPDPRRFTKWAHDHGLDLGFNVHPSIALGDPRFAAANARAGGLIPFALGPTVVDLATDPPAAADPSFTFDWADPRHTAAYFSLHEPFERDGVDFWWLDWCCEEARVQGLIPDGTVSGDAWINHLYAAHNRARGSRWPDLARAGASFEDWTGDRPGPWGEQRSTIHFTGDAFSEWPVLDFESRFTVGEGNAGMPYVSHDIGGFQGGPLSDDLYVRWLQAGAFQPILRLHSSSGGDQRRLPWEYRGRARALGADALRLRESLVPYLYTLSRQAHDTGLPLTRGPYLRWPEEDDAYRFDRQYLLGDDLLVAPVGTPGDPAAKRVWFPPGTWVDAFTGERRRGPAVDTLSVPLDRIPVFARAGAIVPRIPDRDVAAGARQPLRTLQLDVYRGASGRFTLYEDDGETLAYEDGHDAARTTIRFDERSDTLTIGAVRGRFAGQVRRRAYRVRFLGAGRTRVVVTAARPVTRTATVHVPRRR
jgi:alpha-glucosidase (family GH31 glycosyl hydrolase)